MNNLIEERIRKVYGLIVKYTNELRVIDPSEVRYTQVKSYLHCFKNELEFLNSLNAEPSQDDQESDNLNFDFDNDEQY